MKNMNRGFSLLIVAGLFVGVPVHADSLSVHYIMPQTYQLTFSGTVRAGGELCRDAKVVVNLQSSSDQTVEANTAVRPDGTYELKMVVDEYPNVSMNWKVTVSRGGAIEGSLEGSQILASDTDIRMEKSLDLHNQLELALR
jgi:hypothetical protein